MQAEIIENESILMDSVTLMHVEKQAILFDRMLPQLLKGYLGQYVWLMEDEVMDSDVEFSGLFDRVVARVGDAPVFIRRVVADRVFPKVRSAVIR